MTTVNFGDPSTHVNLEVATTLFSVLFLKIYLNGYLKTMTLCHPGL